MGYKIQKIFGSKYICRDINRGTDYLTPEMSGISACSMAYYERTTNHIARKTGGSLKLYVFSDGVEWARRNARLDGPNEFVNINDVFNAHYDLYLQSLCAHNVIANSTMSSMAAWLNGNPGKIVACPKKWYQKKQNRNAHPCPSEWVRIDN